VPFKPIAKNETSGPQRSFYGVPALPAKVQKVQAFFDVPGGFGRLGKRGLSFVLSIFVADPKRRMYEQPAALGFVRVVGDLRVQKLCIWNADHFIFDGFDRSFHQFEFFDIADLITCFDAVAGLCAAAMKISNKLK